MYPRALASWILCILSLVILSGCTTAAAPTTAAALPSAQLSTQTGTKSPAAAIDTAEPDATAEEGEPAYQPCHPVPLIVPGHFLLGRPIGIGDNPLVDDAYRYGGSANRKYAVHHGVDMNNPKGTAVLAAADGRVVVAGADVFFGSKKFFYGNLVILEHQLAGIDVPVFTLYGHLSKVLVEVGQMVAQGQQIGKVGDSGWAIGSHLHFEVRLGENSYAATRNPELWLLPPPGVESGVMAGYILNKEGRSPYVQSLGIRYLSGELETNQVKPVFPERYQGDSVNPDDAWGEQFVVGDLPAGVYEVSFTLGKVFKQQVEIRAGELSLVAFCLDR